MTQDVGKAPGLGAAQELNGTEADESTQDQVWLKERIPPGGVTIALPGSP